MEIKMHIDLDIKTEWTKGILHDVFEYPVIIQVMTDDFYDVLSKYIDADVYSVNGVSPRKLKKELHRAFGTTMYHNIIKNTFLYFVERRSICYN